MEDSSSRDHWCGEMSVDSRKSLDHHCSPSPAQVGGGYRLFDRQRTFHQIIGGGKGTILSITIPALYNKYEVHVDRYAGLATRSFPSTTDSLL